MITAAARSRANVLIRRKLDGEQREKALAYIARSDVTHQGFTQFINRLVAMPDLDSHARRIHDQDVRQRVVAENELGVPQVELAIKYNLPPTTINTWCREAREAEPRWRHTPRDERAEAQAAYVAGARPIDLADRYGVAKSTVSGWIKPVREDKDVATRQAKAEQLVRRCQEVGWTTARNGDGVRVQTPEGPFVIHLTPSDVRSHINTVKTLEKMGLKEAEEALAQQREEARRQKILDDLAANEKKSVAVAKRAAKSAATSKAALARAAGPYFGEPEMVESAWFAEPHPAPWQRWIYLTPALAAYLLEFHNKPGKPGLPGTNRPKSESRIAYYRDIIVSGQWHMTHQGLAMDRREPTPMVQDGQHRLGGLVAAGELLERLKSMTAAERSEVMGGDQAVKKFAGIVDDDGELVDQLRVPVSFTVGMPIENFKAIDDVLLRTAGQLFTQAGEKNGIQLQLAARQLLVYASEDPRAAAKKRYTNIETMQAAEDGGEALRECVSAAVSNSKKAWMSPAPFAAAMYLIGERNGHDNKYVKAFFDGVVGGLKSGTRMVLDDDDPRQALRLSMRDKKDRGDTLRPIDQLGMILTAWDYLVTGRHMRRIRWMGNSEIPEIARCADRGPHASAAPRALAWELGMQDADTLLDGIGDDDDE